MANYDKDMAEERIQIRNDKQKIHEDDKKKKKSEGISMYGSPNHKSYGSPATMKMGTPWTSKHAHKLGGNPDIKYGGAIIDQTAQKSAMKMGHSPAQMAKPDFPRPFDGNKTKSKTSKAGANAYNKANELMKFAAEAELTRKAMKSGVKEALSKRTKEMGGPNMRHSPAKAKMPMVKGKDGKMVPEFAVDGKGKS